MAGTNGRTSYAIHKKKRQSKRPQVDDVYFGGGLTYGKMLGGKTAPFTHAIGFNLVAGLPLFERKGLLEASVETNRDAANKTWYSATLKSPESSFGSIKSGFASELNVAFMYVIKNSKTFAVTAGPVIGGRVMHISPDGDRLTGNQFVREYFYTGTLGVRANLYIQHYMIASVGYSQFMNRYMDVEDVTYNPNTNYIGLYTNPGYAAPMNLNTLYFRLCFYFQPE